MRAKLEIWPWGALAIGLAVFGSLAAPAQESAVSEDATAEETPAPPRLDVKAMLEEDAAVFAGRGYGYDPAGRRDPFRSLLNPQSQADLARGPRPEGIEGLLIGDIDLTGVFVLPEGPVAQVQTSDRDRSFLLRAGDKLYDGEVVSVSLEELVLRQVVDDPTAMTPFREVVKRLNP